MWGGRERNSETTGTNFVRLKVVLLGIVFLVCLPLVGPTPVQDLPPGCLRLCIEYPGTFTECSPDCPTMERCREAMAEGPQDEYYIDEDTIVKQGPQLCEDHCWEATVFTEKSCMMDCPGTWCRQYGGLPAPTPAPSTSHPDAVTAMSPTEGSGSAPNGTLPEASPVVTGVSKGWIVVWSVLGSLAFIALAVSIGVCSVRWHRRHRGTGGKGHVYHPTSQPQQNGLITSATLNPLPDVNTESPV